jgi:UDP-N-acetylglucosamine acyltransferase
MSVRRGARANMTTIHPSARIAAEARLADDVEIGPNCTVGGEVTIGQGCRLTANVNISGRTSIGRDTTIDAFASLGTPPQSTAPFDPAGRLIVGTGCKIGGHVTINVGTKDGGGLTQIGDRCLLMNNSHVGHDCLIGADVILGIGAALAGHCHVGDFTQFGSFSAAHQYSHIGASATIDIRTFVRSDIIPFGVASGDIAHLRGVNHAGMRERKFSDGDIKIAEEVYQGIFFGTETFASRVDLAAKKYQGHVLADQIIDFIRTVRHRALCHPVPPTKIILASGAVRAIPMSSIVTS